MPWLFSDLRRLAPKLSRLMPPGLRQASSDLRLFFRVRTADGGAWFRANLHGEAPDRRAEGLLLAASLPNSVRPLLAVALRLAGQRHLAFAITAARKSQGAALRRIEADLAEYRAAFSRAMDIAGVDVVLSPPVAVPALRHGGSKYLSFANVAAYTLLYNVLGFPAGVVPVTTVESGEESDRPASLDLVERAAREAERGSAGLPVGVQVAARMWREDLILSAMSVIEDAVRAREEQTSALFSPERKPSAGVYASRIVR